jgi:hypothetical protein
MRREFDPTTGRNHVLITELPYEPRSRQRMELAMIVARLERIEELLDEALDAPKGSPLIHAAMVKARALARGEREPQ